MTKINGSNRFQVELEDVNDSGYHFAYIAPNTIEIPEKSKLKITVANVYAQNRKDDSQRCHIKDNINGKTIVAGDDALVPMYYDYEVTSHTNLRAQWCQWSGVSLAGINDLRWWDICIKPYGPEVLYGVTF